MGSQRRVRGGQTSVLVDFHQYQCSIPAAYKTGVNLTANQAISNFGSFKMNEVVLVPVYPGVISLIDQELPVSLSHRSQRILNGSPPFALRLGNDGDLISEPIGPNQRVPSLTSGDSSIAALMCCKSSGSKPSWLLIACSNCIGLNGQTPLLPITAIELGDLLTIEDRGWMVSSLWRPVPVDAPAELRDKPCPVCGGALGVARVVECTCGRWSHLENPDDADDPKALNCFLTAGVCGECGRRASLEPQLVPDVPASLTVERFDAED